MPCDGNGQLAHFGGQAVPMQVFPPYRCGATSLPSALLSFMS